MNKLNAYSPSPAAALQTTDSRSYSPRGGIKPRFARLSVLLVAGFMLGAPVSGFGQTDTLETFKVPNDWLLKPAGLAVGDHFRLIYVSSGVATFVPTTVADYNARVQTHISNGGHASIQPYSAHFSAMVAATGRNMDVNTNTRGTDPAAEIYWLNGDKIADDYAGLYDGSWASCNMRTQSGASKSGNVYNNNVASQSFVGTGANSDGTAHNHNVTHSNRIRYVTVPLSGSNCDALGQDRDNSASSGRNAGFNIYGISPRFQVATSDTLSTNADLSGLTVTGAGATLHQVINPTDPYGALIDFSSSVTSYFVDVTDDNFTITTTISVDATITYRANNVATTVTVGDPTDLGVAIITAAEVTDLPMGETDITLTVTAEDGITKKTYTLYVTRGNLSYDATLTELTLTTPATALDQTFAPGTEAYTATVANGVDGFTITATQATGASVAYSANNGTTVINGVVTGLPEGETVITITVTAENGSTTKDYTLTVTRAASDASRDATLVGLSMSNYSISPIFDPATTEYTLTEQLPNSENTIIIEEDDMGELDDRAISRVSGEFIGRPGSIITTAVDGTMADVSHTYLEPDGAGNRYVFTISDLPVGDTTLTITVTAADGVATEVYTLTVTRADDGEATLGALSLSGAGGATISPAFDPATTRYTTSVSNSVEGFTINALATSRGATIEYDALDGAKVTTSGVVFDLPDDDDARIRIYVYSEDGNDIDTYTLTVTRAREDGMNDATLSALSLSGDGGATISPAFVPGTTEYTTAVSSSVVGFTINAVAANSGATVAYAVDNGATRAGNVVTNLQGGETVITITVTATAADTTTTTNVYTLTVTRLTGTRDLSSDANLISLNFSDPIRFDSTALDSTQDVVNPDTIIGPRLSPPFMSDTTAYEVEVAEGIFGFTINTTASSGAEVVVYTNDDTTANVSPDGVVTDLPAGEMEIMITVTSEDGTTRKDYTLIVTVNGPSADAAPNPAVTLTMLTVSGSGATLNEDFMPATTDYTVSVGESTQTFTIVPNLPTGATIAYTHDGPGPQFLTSAVYTLPDGTTSHLPDGVYDLGVKVSPGGVVTDLPVGETVITLTVTAEECTTPDDCTTLEDYTNYILTVTRAASGASNNAGVSGVIVSGVGVTHGAGNLFDPDVVNSTTGVTIAPVLADDGATVAYSIDAPAVVTLDGINGVVTDLPVGETDIIITVTAEDRTTTIDYDLTVTRATASSTDATLTDLTLTDLTRHRSTIPLGATFVPATLAYAVDVGSDFGFAIKATPTTTGAALSYTADAPAMVTSDGVVSALPVGSTTEITVTVTATDDSATEAYTLTVTREASDDATLWALTLTDPDIDIAGTFDSATTEYTASVGNSVEGFTINVAPANGATVAYSDDDAAVTVSTEGVVTNLPEGSPTVITLTVTAEDGSTEQAYTLTVTRATMGTDTNLATLTVTNPTFTGANIDNSISSIGPSDRLGDMLVPGITKHAVSVLSVVSGFTITAIPVSGSIEYAIKDPAYTNAEVNSEVNSDGNSVGVVTALPPGETVIILTVTSSDTTAMQDYTLTVTQENPPPNNLTALSLSNAGDATLNPPFAPATTEYKANVANSVEGFTITAAPDSGATVGYAITTSGSPAMVTETATGSEVTNLPVGETVITITVTAADNSMREYTLTVTRAASSDATLSGLTVSGAGATLRQTFTTTNTDYDVDVINATGFTINPTLPGGATAGYAITTSGSLAMVTETGGIVTDLPVGETVITLTVTAEDRTTERAYILTVTSTVVALPGDLEITAAPTATPASVPVNTAFTLGNIVVSNTGGTDIGGSLTVTYYQSTDTTIDTGDPAVGTPATIPGGIAANSDHTALMVAFAPATAGTWYYGACVATVTGDDDTTNNCSPSVMVVVTPVDSAAPDAPTGLTATAVGSTRIDLSWTAPANNRGSAITGYQIEFSTDRGSNYNDLANTGATTTTYSHTGLAPGTTVHYRVAAINAVGTGANSVADSATTTAPGGPTVVSLTAADGTYGIDGEVVITVRFTEAVDVDTTGGTPQLTLETGSSDGVAVYDSGSGLANLEFIYTVVAGHESSDLDAMAANSLDPDGGTIVATTGGAAAALTLPVGTNANSLASRSAVVIDGVAPTIASATINRAGTTITVEASEPLVGTALAADFTATVAGTDATPSAAEIDASGNIVLTIAPAAVPGEVITLAYTGTTQKPTDAAGNDLADKTESVTVTRMSNDEFIEKLNDNVLVQVVQATTATIVDTVAARVAAVAGGAVRINTPTPTPTPTPTTNYTVAGENSLAGIISTHGRAMIEGTMDYARLLDGATFSMPLSGGSARGGNTSLSMWGSLNYTDLDGDTDDLLWDGTVRSGIIGVDGAIGARTVAGVGVSHTTSTMRYDDPDDGGGDYDYTTIGVIPYIGWADPTLRLWSALGYGSGEITIDPDVGDPESTDATQQFISLGVESALWNIGSAAHLDRRTVVSLKWDASFSEVDVEEGDGGSFKEDTLSGSRLRLLVVGERQMDGDTRGVVLPRAELGMRSEKSEISTAGGEFGVGLRYTSPAGGFTLDGNLRTLFANDYDEWGADLTLRSVSSRSRGLYLTLSPGAGDVSSEVQTLWEDGPAALNDDGDAGYGIDFEVGYGVGATVLHTAGTLTPYLRLADRDDDGTLSIGANFTGQSRNLNLSVEGTHSDTKAYGIKLGASVNW